MNGGLCLGSMRPGDGTEEVEEAEEVTSWLDYCCFMALTLLYVWEALCVYRYEGMDLVQSPVCERRIN